MKTKLALFDFDGTLIDNDSLWSFLFSSFPRQKVLSAIIKNGVGLISAKFIPSQRSLMKEKLLKSVFKGYSKNDIQSKGKSFGESIPLEHFTKIYPKFLDLKSSHEVVIVSASLDIWLSSFAIKEDVKLICTRWDYDEMSFGSKNCNYDEKKNRIEREINLELYEEILVFGDSAGDDAMYSLAKKKG